MPYGWATLTSSTRVQFVWIDSFSKISRLLERDHPGKDPCPQLEVQNMRVRIGTLLAALGAVTLLFGLASGLILLSFYSSIILEGAVIITDIPNEYIRGLAWSPDGRQVAFECVTRGLLSGETIYVMDADGSNLHVRKDDEKWATGFSCGALSPDRSQIAFVKARSPSPSAPPPYHLDYDSCNSNIFVKNVSKTGRHRVFPLMEIELQCPWTLSEDETVTITTTVSSTSARDLPISVEMSEELGTRGLKFNPSGSREITLPANDSAEIAWDMTLTSDERKQYLLRASAVPEGEGMCRSTVCPVSVGVSPPKILDVLGLTLAQGKWLPLVSLPLGFALSGPWLYARRRDPWGKVLIAVASIVFCLAVLAALCMYGPVALIRQMYRPTHVC